MMYLDSDPVTGDHEWVCRACGVRLYGGTSADAQEPPIATEKPVNENAGTYQEAQGQTAVRLLE